MTDESKVTQWQDAYPVYAKYDVNYTTNLHRKGFDGTPGVINVPAFDIKPDLVVRENGDVVATVSPDVSTTVYADGTGGAYQLKKLEIELPTDQLRCLSLRTKVAIPTPIRLSPASLIRL